MMPLELQLGTGNVMSEAATFLVSRLFPSGGITAPGARVACNKARKRKRGATIVEGE